MRENHVRALVGVHQMPRSVIQDRLRRSRREFRFHYRFFEIRLHWGTPVVLAGKSEVTRVPGKRAPLAAASKPFGTEPPTMRTSATPAERARLQASSLRIIPPETLFWRIMSSASLVETTFTTFEPSSTPATSVR